MVPGSGSRVGSSSRVKSEKPVTLADGDGGTEGFELVPEGISGVDDGRVGVRDCSLTPGSPSNVAMGTAAVSRDAGTVVSGIALRRVGGGGRPSQPVSRSSKTSCNL
jgi:hypothetical protein